MRGAGQADLERELEQAAEHSLSLGAVLLRVCHGDDVILSTSAPISPVRGDLIQGEGVVWRVVARLWGADLVTGRPLLELFVEPAVIPEVAQPARAH